MRPNSLRLQLLGWVLLPLAGVAAFNAYSSYRGARETALLVTDRMLIAAARTIAEQTQVDAGIVSAQVPPAALEMFDTGEKDRVYYRVESKGILLAGYGDLPLAPEPSVGPSAYEAAYRDEPMRLLTFHHSVADRSGEIPVDVTVATTLNSQTALTARLWIASFGQQFALVTAAGMLMLFGLQRGMAPLLKLRDLVLGRGRNNLDPLPEKFVQREIQPLVKALNEHMSRVAKQMAAQQRFVANAAHQLRTPLTLLSVQAAYALRQQGQPEQAETLGALQASTQQLARLAGQLLTLARAEPGSRRKREDRVDMAAVAREVLDEFARPALEKRIDLGLEAAAAAPVVGDKTMLREMLINLVDNALRYTPPGGTITVRAEQRDASVVLCVQDDGPGIPPAERDRVFERFYRILGTEGDGSGLGLAIVSEIVATHGGNVRLASPEVGTGLIAEVVLPAESRAA